ncbi:MAG: c-type cytochrome [Leptospiraceae bacterium]|nr:c-type cytochrome [Leptospiraceae bacterium]
MQNQPGNAASLTLRGVLHAPAGFRGPRRILGRETGNPGLKDSKDRWIQWAEQLWIATRPLLTQITLTSILLTVWSASLTQCTGADPGEEYSGGWTTHFDTSLTAFNRLAKNSKDYGHAMQFNNGHALFKQRWQPAATTRASFDGLGPLLNQTACDGCHAFGGRGRPPLPDENNFSSMVMLLSAADKTMPHGEPVPLPKYGLQLNDKGIAGVPAEGRVTISYTTAAGRFPDGESYTLRRPTYSFSGWNYGPPVEFAFSPRVAPFIFGMGLLQSIPAETLQGWADPDDKDGDGISGRINKIYDKYSFAYQTGRFGWKAGQASIKNQNLSAFIQDMGITNHLYPEQNCTISQTACIQSPPGSQKPTEVSAGQTDELEIYFMLIGVPGRRDWQNPQVRQGKELFSEIGCADCHRPETRTAKRPAYPEISEQLIRPYTDLLLHDMGPELADHRSEHLASGQEWRTPPLWGIGLVERINGHNFLLHDGRARGFQEAILWHGGEAERSRERYKELPRASRQALLRFLQSL